MLAAAAALVSCELDFYRSDTMTSSMLKENPGAAVYTTDGNYSMFKDRIDYSNSRSGNEYPRLVLLMSELRGDNVALSGRTTDPLYQNMTYTLFFLDLMQPAKPKTAEPYAWFCFRRDDRSKLLVAFAASH